MNERGLFVIPSADQDTNRELLSVKVCVHLVQRIQVSHVSKVFIHIFQVTNVQIHLKSVSINANHVAKDSDTEDLHATENVYQVSNSDQVLLDLLSVTSPEIGTPGQVKLKYSIHAHLVWKKMVHCATNSVARVIEVMVLCVRKRIWVNTRQCMTSRNKNSWVY